MKIQKIQDQQTFKADWFHLPKGQKEGFNIQPKDIPNIIKYIGDSFEYGQIERDLNTVKLDAYEGSTGFKIGETGIVLANSPKKIKNAKQLPYWAIFIKYKLPEGGFTAIYRNAEGVPDVEFDALKGLLLHVLRTAT